MAPREREKKGESEMEAAFFPFFYPSLPFALSVFVGRLVPFFISVFPTLWREREREKEKERESERERERERERGKRAAKEVALLASYQRIYTCLFPLSIYLPICMGLLPVFPSCISSGETKSRFGFNFRILRRLQIKGLFFHVPGHPFLE